jgi:hypothetical protein
MDTASTVVESGVILPVYESIAGNLLRQFEHASSVTSTSTDDEGETYALFASVIPAEDVPDGSIMIVPLTPPAEEDVLDFTFLSSGKSLFVKILYGIQLVTIISHSGGDILIDYILSIQYTLISVYGTVLEYDRFIYSNPLCSPYRLKPYDIILKTSLDN